MITIETREISNAPCTAMTSFLKIIQELHHKYFVGVAFGLVRGATGHLHSDSYS